MSSYFKQIPGYIKYLAIIARDNTPLLFFNLHNEELELSYQLLVFGSLDMLESKDEGNQDKNEEEYKGLLMPFYEFEQDLASYGFIGNNGIKICVIKKYETQNFSSDKKLQIICKDTYLKFNKLLLNPFYDKKAFSESKSVQRDKFAQSVLDMLTQSQII